MPSEQDVRQGEQDNVICAECGRSPRTEENAEDDWRVESDGVGELHVFCPECWQREFGSMRT